MPAFSRSCWLIKKICPSTRWKKSAAHLKRYIERTMRSARKTYKGLRHLNTASIRRGKMADFFREATKMAVACRVAPLGTVVTHSPW